VTPPDEPAPPGRATPTEAASALDALGAGVLVVDRAGQIVLSNPRAAEILGRPEASLSGRALVDVLAPSRRCSRRRVSGPRSPCLSRAGVNARSGCR
jgi:PAS domain-containing protein